MTRIMTTDNVHIATGSTGFGARKNNYEKGTGRQYSQEARGRWPANICHDGSDEVLALFPETKSGILAQHHVRKGKSQIGTFDIRDRTGEPIRDLGDEGSAAEFFYCAKAGRLDRIERPPRTKYVYELKDNTPQELIDEITKYIK